MLFTCREAPLNPTLVDLIAAIPELRATSFDEIVIRARPRPLLLVAETDRRRVGFKLGYEFDPGTFYSWIGGVPPMQRRHGIARALLHEQERLVAQRGYRRIRVKSMPRFPGMLALLASAGYAIVAHEPDGKIVYEKLLAASASPS